MDSTVLIIITLLIVLCVFVFFSKDKKNEQKNKKSYYLRRFIRNRESSLSYINQVEAIMKENDGWNKQAFADKNLTFSEYLKILKDKHNQEYSESIYKILKKDKLSFSQKQEFTKKLVEQSEDLYLMEVELGFLNKNWVALVH